MVVMVSWTHWAGGTGIQSLVDLQSDAFRLFFLLFCFVAAAGAFFTQKYDASKFQALDEI